jgi:hypothetical protein
MADKPWYITLVSALMSRFFAVEAYLEVAYPRAPVPRQNGERRFKASIIKRWEKEQNENGVVVEIYPTEHRRLGEIRWETCWLGTYIR